MDKKELKEITDSFFQTEYAFLIIQKMKLIQGDWIMKRNFEKNLGFLKMFVFELDKKIVRGRINGEQTEGFELLQRECQVWIDLMVATKNDFR